MVQENIELDPQNNSDLIQTNTIVENIIEN